MLGGRGCRKRQGGRGKKGGGRGWGDGGGEGGGERGWGEALIEVLNKTGIVSFSSVIGMHITRRNRPKSRFSRGIPNFWEESPCNDITFSKIRHNLARKVRKRDVREISPNYISKKEQPSWKSEKMPHFEFLNLNISLLNGRQIFIFQI